MKTYTEKPHDINVRGVVSSELFGSPDALMGVSEDIVHNYMNKDINQRFEEERNKIYNITESNLDIILDNLISESDPNSALSLIINLPSLKTERDTYKELTKLHSKTIEAHEAYVKKDVDSIIRNLVEDYGLSNESLIYHVNADPEGLVRIYGKTILKSREKTLGKNLSNKEGTIDKFKTSNFAKYLTKEAEDKKDYALALISESAFNMYRSKKE